MLGSGEASLRRRHWGRGTQEMYVKCLSERMKCLCDFKAPALRPTPPPPLTFTPSRPRSANRKDTGWCPERGGQPPLLNYVSVRPLLGEKLLSDDSSCLPGRAV